MGVMYILYFNEKIIKEINVFSENRKLNFFGPAQVDLKLRRMGIGQLQNEQIT